MSDFWNLLGLVRSLSDVLLDVAFVWLVLVVGNAVLFAVGEVKRRRSA